jgi:hypothetical protein
MIWAATYALVAFCAMAWKAYHDAAAGRSTNVLQALATGAFWPIIWPIMLGQVYGARARERKGW